MVDLGSILGTMDSKREYILNKIPVHHSAQSAYFHIHIYSKVEAI